MAGQILEHFSIPEKPVNFYMRIKLTLAYDGGDYHGWQVQKDRPTIQGVMEDALKKICSIPVRVHGSGRTDAGVHASGQVAHFDVPEGKTGIPWQQALNSILPESVRVIRSMAVNKDFHSRFSVISKTYSYTFWTESDFVLPQRRNYVWKTGPLDVDSMRGASLFLLGKKDFRALMNTGTRVRSTWREVKGISFASGLYPQELVFTITADGFLKQMVRNIVGVLVVIGLNKYPSTFLEQTLSAGKRGLAPATSPARGLCLEYVEYPDQYSAH